MHQINSVLILPISLQRMASSDMTGNHHLHGVSLIRNLPVRYISYFFYSALSKKRRAVSRSPLSVRSPLILFPYRLKICTTSKESLILSPLDRRIAEEPLQRFFGFFGKVDIEFWHHADLLP